MEGYSHKKIEKKWQKIWEKNKIFEAKNVSKKKKFYCLDMFPYPSSAGLHVGHLKGYTISDVIAKKKIMEGYNVLHPMGFDAFGLPAENYAIKTGVHPAITISKAIKNIKRQLISSGFGYDWQREINTSKPDYYKFTQWIFLTLFKNGLAYKKKAAVNFCPSCKTVLAREQVIDGKCERCSQKVEKKDMEQWFFKITDYAEKLLEGLKKIDWPENIKTMQKNWIGRSKGSEIIFPLNVEGFELRVFTTRADTLFGVTYLVTAPEHPVLEKLKDKIKNWLAIEKYIKLANEKTEIERTSEDREKDGIKIEGIEAIHPLTQEKIPIFVADYILVDYGTGAVMGVPAHDQRDFLFAKKYNLPIKEVIRPKEGKSLLPQMAFIEDGILINSKAFSDLTSEKARKEITKYLSQRKLGKETICYKLRDWCISRQRYWGAPIPIVFCPKCGNISVPEKELPILLPKTNDFLPAGQGKSPLAKIEKFLKTKCPKCGKIAQRETDTMDTFVCSSWYYLAYPFWHKYKNQKLNSHNVSSLIHKWLPVDLYIGGAEHAVMHLLYARFLTKVLFDLKYLNFDEPFLKLFNQGTIYYQGAKMSKSKGNVVSPEYIFEKYGADTLRLYELFMGPAEQATEWSDKGVVGCFRFLKRVWNLREKIKNKKLKRKNDLEKLVHKTIKKVTEDIDNFRFNTAISALMILLNEMEKEKEIVFINYESLIKLLAPMAPHLAEEMWQKLGHKKSIFLEKWPEYNHKLIEEKTFNLVVQINGKVRDVVCAPFDISENDAKKFALKSEKIQKWVKEKKVLKIFYIKNKLINILIE